MIDIRIYDRALTSSEISALFNEQAPVASGWQTNYQNLYINDGKVVIGSQEPMPGYDLSVKGKIAAEEIKVTADGWPDFVFSNEYDLMTLNEVEKYILSNSHLPEIPSQSQVLKWGVELGDLNSKLIQKIEELTLYLIQENKELKVHREEIDKLKKSE